MNLIRLVEQLAATEEDFLILDAAGCLHSHDRFSDCAACFDVCPVGAIEPGRPPRLDPEACVKCRACLPVCPVGAYAGPDEVPDLINCAAVLGRKRIELLCGRNPNKERGPKSAEAAIQLRGCLAGVGAGAYLLLSAGGLEAVDVRLDGCADCAWSSLVGEIEEQVAQARQLLTLWDRAECVNVVEEGGKSWQPRPVHRAESPPVSRRDLFRRLREGSESAERPVADGYRPFHERLRTLTAIEQLPAPPDLSRAIPESAGFAAVSISEECVACGTCARGCPTGALQVEQDETHFWHTFMAATCLACEVCVHLCAEDAITLDRMPTLDCLCAPEPSERITVLEKREIVRCARCKATFAPSVSGQKLCRVCNFRRQNPFSATLPPSVARRLGLPADDPLKTLGKERDCR